MTRYGGVVLSLGGCRGEVGGLLLPAKKDAVVEAIGRGTNMFVWARSFLTLESWVLDKYARRCRRYLEQKEAVEEATRSHQQAASCLVAALTFSGCSVIRRNLSGGAQLGLGGSDGWSVVSGRGPKNC